MALINLLTNPALNWLLLVASDVAPENHELRLVVPVLVAGEILVVFAEWRLLLWVLGGERRRMLVNSVVMNACSFLVGLAVFWL